MTIGVAQMDGAFTDAEESSPATKTLPSVRRETPSLAKQPALGAQRRAQIYPPDLLIECPQPKGVGGTARADVFETHRADVRSDEAVAAQLSGSISDGVSKARTDVELTFLGLEFGTRSVMDVLTALRNRRRKRLSVEA
jgi:hypothetical protein